MSSRRRTPRPAPRKHNPRTHVDGRTIVGVPKPNSRRGAARAKAPSPRNRAVAAVGAALDRGLVLTNDEMTAGPYSTAVDRGERFAIFVDRPAHAHWLPKGRHVYRDSGSVALSLVARYGATDAQKLVAAAERRASAKRNGAATRFTTSRTIHGRRWTAVHDKSFECDPAGGAMGKDTDFYLDSFPIGQAICPGLSDDGTRYGFGDESLWPFVPNEYDTLSESQREARWGDARKFVAGAAKRIVAARKGARRASAPRSPRAVARRRSAR